MRTLFSLYSSHQQKNAQNNDDQTEPATSIISGPVKWPSPDAAETSQQAMIRIINIIVPMLIESTS